MRRAWFLACWAFVGASIALACGGSSDSGLFGSSGDVNASSSGTTSSSGTASSSGTTSSGGTSGTTSSGGTSGTTSSGGSSGTTVVDAGVDAGRGCRRAVESDCASGEYCKVTNCADKGVCTKKPDPNTAQGDIVCGCDGISYYS